MASRFSVESQSPLQETWHKTPCLFASVFPGVYPYLGRVAINCWRKGLGGENRGPGFDCHRLGQWVKGGDILGHQGGAKRLRHPGLRGGPAAARGNAARRAEQQGAVQRH